MCTFEDYEKLQLTDWYRETVRLELPRWHTFPVSQGGTVLDLGAGCGETALYYLNHGAGKVIAIESDPEALKMLRANFGKDPRVIIIPEQISEIKIDVDGAEKEMVLETHFPHYWKRIWAPPSKTVDANQWILKERFFPFLNMRWKRHWLKIHIAHWMRVGIDFTKRIGK